MLITKSNPRYNGLSSVVDLLDGGRFLCSMVESDADRLIGVLLAATNAGSTAPVVARSGSLPQDNALSLDRFLAMSAFCANISTSDLQTKTIADYFASLAFGEISSTQGDGDVKLKISGGAVALIGSALAGAMVGVGAKNYIQLCVNHPDVGDLMLTVQRADGLTPAQLKEVSDKKCAMLANALHEITRASDAVSSGTLQDMARIALLLSGEGPI